ncbi:MAG: hypothetical protein LBB67_03000 [Oscillospiraceae bacterium]|nr:hypothetical protein [Oscillospiraceae bacterium]
MTITKKLICALLAAVLLFSFAGCSLTAEEEEPVQVTEPVLTAKTPLPSDQDAAAYFAKLLALVNTDARSYHWDFSIAVDDVQTENEPLAAVAGTIKKLAQNAAKTSGDWNNLQPEGEALPMFAAQISDHPFSEITVRTALNLTLESKIKELKKDAAEGRKEELKNADDAAFRNAALNALGEETVTEQAKIYQINAVFAPAALAEWEQAVWPAFDQEAFDAELKKADAYLSVKSHKIIPQDMTVFAQVDNETDYLSKLELKAHYQISAVVVGEGAFADAGEIPLTFTLEKTYNCSFDFSKEIPSDEVTDE